MSESDGILLTIILVARNEEATLAEMVRRIDEVPLSREIIILDDASTDRTPEIIEGLDYPGLRKVFKPAHRGKGDSVKEGIRLARGRYAVVQDADLEYDPQDLLRLLETVQQPGVAAVLGSRMLWLREQGRHLPRNIHNLGRDALHLFFRLLYGSHLTDITTCYKMASVELLRGLDLHGNGFDLDFELAAKLVRRAGQLGQRMVEVPVAYYPRSVAEGKKIRWWHGVEALWMLLRYRFWR